MGDLIEENTSLREKLLDFEEDASSQRKQVK